MCYTKIPKDCEKLDSEEKVTKKAKREKNLDDLAEEFMDEFWLLPNFPKKDEDIEEEYPETYTDRERGNRRTYSSGNYSHSLYSRKQKKYAGRW